MNFPDVSDLGRYGNRGDDWGGSGGGGGGCFIATAAYGSELAPPVQFLKDFRDRVVLMSRFGKAFQRILDVYYRFSPPVAAGMRRNRVLKHAVKYAVVWPFVVCAVACAYAVRLAYRRRPDAR